MLHPVEQSGQTLSADGEQLELLGASHMPDAVRDAWRTFSVSAKVPLADVARTGEPIFLESRDAWIARYPEFGPLLEATGHHANAVTPLIVDERILGVLGMAFDVPRSFDHTRRHSEVAASGFAVTAVAIAIVGLVNMPVWLLLPVMAVGGFCTGMIMPSRDMLVRAAAPKGAEGRVFAIVSTGFNIGGIVGPLLYGGIMDYGQPGWIFAVSVGFMLATTAIALAGDRRARLAAAE